MTMAKINYRKLGIWAGITAPVLFVGIFLLEGWLRPGYDAMSQYVSELSLGPRGWIQIANFLITGLLLLLFAFSVRAEFKEGMASRFGPVLLIISALALLVSGPLVMDPRQHAARSMDLARHSASINWRPWVFYIGAGDLFCLLAPIPRQEMAPLAPGRSLPPPSS